MIWHLSCSVGTRLKEFYGTSKHIWFYFMCDHYRLKYTASVVHTGSQEVLCLINFIENVWGTRVAIPFVHNLGTRLREGAASCPSHFTHADSNLCSHWVRGWLSTRAAVIMMVTR